MPRDAKTRRAAGQGSKVFKRPNGRFAAFVTLGYRKGRQHKKWLYGASEREVVQKQNKFMASSSGVVLAPRENISACGWLERYADNRGRDRAASTREKYKSYLKHCRTGFGDMKLSKLSALSLRAFFSQLQDKGLSPSTRQHIYDFVSGALEDAVNLEQLDKNPMRQVARPRGGTVRVSGIWTPEEVAALLVASQGYGVQLLLRVALTLGLRIGEALALRWSDLKGDMLEVKHTLGQFKGDAMFRPCKADSRRVLALDTSTVEAFAEQRAKQAVQRTKAQAGELWTEHGLIFASEVGTPIRPRNAARALDAIIERAGVTRHSSHAMRKTYASLASLYLSPREVQERLGHKDPRMTLGVYTRVHEYRKKESALPLAQLLTPSYTLQGCEP